MKVVIFEASLFILLLMISGCNTHSNYPEPVFDDTPVVTPTATDYEFIVRKGIKKMP